MEFVETIGEFLVIAFVVFLLMYGIRHRGRIWRWVENINHEGNDTEKEDYIIKQRRLIEDAQRQLKRLEEKD